MVSRKRLTHDRRVGVRRRSQPESPERCESRDTFSTSQFEGQPLPVTQTWNAARETPLSLATWRGGTPAITNHK